MFPLSDYYQVLTIYLIIGLILCLPPLILPQWKSLVRFLNKIETEHKKFLEILFFSISIVIILIAIVLISFFNSNLIMRLEFEDINAEAQYFNIFATFTFLLMPIAMALIAATTYIHNCSKIKFGEFFILLFAFSALALAGAFYHDFLWCGNATNWYTELSEGGYDFDVWLQLVGLDNRDYRLLGASQGTLALILIVFCIILLWRFNSFSEVKLTRQKMIKIIILAFFIVIFFGLFLFIIDTAGDFDSNITFHSLFIGMPLIGFLFYQLGKTLVSI